MGKVKTFGCGNCQNGKITFSNKLTETGVLMTITKCDCCGHQYVDLKELNQLKML